MLPEEYILESLSVPFGPIWLRNLKNCSNMQCFCIPFKPYCSKMAKRDTYSNTTLRPALCAFFETTLPLLFLEWCRYSCLAQ